MISICTKQRTTSLFFLVISLQWIRNKENAWKIYEQINGHISIRILKILIKTQISIFEVIINNFLFFWSKNFYNDVWKFGNKVDKIHALGYFQNLYCTILGRRRDLKFIYIIFFLIKRNYLFWRKNKMI